MKCIIYGLSTCRKQVEFYLNENVDIIGYSDSFSNFTSYNNKIFYKPSELIDLDFDILIIAINKMTDCLEVEKYLLNIGINKYKIVPLYKIIKFISKIKCTSNYIEESLKNNNIHIEGLCFGLSYGQVAIIPKYLDFNLYNFCLGSQDLYYTLQQIRYLKKEHREKLNNLKYVLLDMYNYTYFNYDVSLTKNAFNFIYDNGFQYDVHNLNRNKNYSTEIVNISKENLSNNEIMFFKQIFKLDIMQRKDKRYYFNEKEIDYCLDDEELKRNNIFPMGYSSIQNKCFLRTEKENIKIFEDILYEISELDKNIKIYLILIPRYMTREISMLNIESIWKEKFYKILEKYSHEYEFELLDLKNNSYLSNKREFYMDLEHLNYEGSKKFTLLLNDYIKNGNKGMFFYDKLSEK